MSKVSDVGDSVFSDPEYREKYREKFLEAQDRGMDMVVYPDGVIVLIENKMAMHTYKWRKRRGDFERVKAGVSSVRRKNSSAAAPAISREPVVETEYA